MVLALACPNYSTSETCNYFPVDPYMAIAIGLLLMLFGLLIAVACDYERHVASLWFLLGYAIIYFIIFIIVCLNLAMGNYAKDLSDTCKILIYVYPVIILLLIAVLLADYILELLCRFCC